MPSPSLLRSDTSPAHGGGAVAGAKAERETSANSQPASGTLYTEYSAAPVTWQVPEEVPVAIQINSEPYAVMMATPADLDDFAVGFALAEGLVRQVAHVRGVLALPEQDGYALDLSIKEADLDPSRLVKRSLEGRVGCGLCGIADIKDAIRMPRGRVAAARLDAAAVRRAYAALPGFQPMNAVNRTVHAAAWCSVDGAILLSREDVGRHNALDKLIGALARQGADFTRGFVLMSSRCSFELVQKCAIAGIGALATISAPTALALRLANEAGLRLAALAHGDVMIFEQES